MKNTSYTCLKSIIGSIFILTLFFSCNDTKTTMRSENTFQIIPKPVSLIASEGEFMISEATQIYVESDSSLANEVEYLNLLFETAAGFRMQTVSDRNENTIVISTHCNNTEMGNEGYSLQISPSSIELKANTVMGIFYGIQSLRQLLAPEVESKTQQYLKAQWAVPACSITDYPRFAYRGMHLDVCRHFFSVEFVKQYIDYLALHKLNKFHWHLTEDQGWRIEIKKYPKLTEISSQRKETIIGKTDQYDQTPYGGFYTQEEIKEIVAYAAQRHITVIPEIEMPGHSVAALAAYPELSCTGGHFEVMTKWGVSKDIYCAGKEETFVFLQNVLDEVMALFPSTYIHIGGDEAPKKRWHECPDCQKRMQTEGLANENELQSYFIKRMEKYLNSKGRKLIGWDEILEGGLAPDATVMSWRGMSGGLAAAQQNHPVIMTPYSHLYFDGYQGDREIEPLAIGYWSPIERVYDFEPIPSTLAVDKQKYIIGAQANLWTEFIATPEYAEYMVLPRMSALSEVVWSPKDTRNWNDFATRLQAQYHRLFFMNAHFRIPPPNIDKVVHLAPHDSLTIGNPMGFGTIRYTTDGSAPDSNSAVYNAKLAFEQHTILRTALFTDDGRHSPILTSQIVKTEKAPEGKIFGIHYRYFEGDYRNQLPDFKNIQPIRTGQLKGIDLKSTKHRDDNFGLHFTGFIQLPETGNYDFYVLSDNESKLIIDGKTVLNVDSYITEAKHAAVHLTEGMHRFDLYYTEFGWSEKLSIWVKSPTDKQKRWLPAHWLLIEK